MGNLSTLKPYAFIMRPHHLLCLPGYKGYNYNKEIVSSWDSISKAIIENPDINVKITEGKDALCYNCPTNDVKGASCNQKLVGALDEKVKKLLGLEDGNFYKYSDLAKKIRDIMNPKTHEELCGWCNWRKLGLCKDTFEKVN